MRQAGREMMLDLVIETTRDPPEDVADHGHRRCDVDRCAQLMGRELVAPAGTFRYTHLGGVDACASWKIIASTNPTVHEHTK